ncbi:sigma-54 interaction domain-containing protein [Inediibacterium massiliense]|uniref:sigma-54 interaction domain-containing protein n=1 Tax=Inediibacterium massiliense TaxID=1658111 RepID=UPI0006B5AF3F|nr:sigma 54-interacting transcriptional regulator [Inediibacterium massiliense]
MKIKNIEITKWMNKIFNSFKEGILIVDQKTRIVFFNRSYSQFINRDLNEVQGRYIKEIRPGALIPEVVKTGIPKLGILRKENDDEYFCNMYPILSDEEIVGGISTVTFIKDAVELSNKIKELERKNKYLMERIHHNNGTRYKFEDIIAKSKESIDTKNIAIKISSSDIPVLIYGESGTGKELYAQSIHNESLRKDHPFIAVNCATLTSTMLESELFGYEEGAFTGAKKGGKMGLFEAANKGTIFLDEISEIDYNLQAKLLRVLQEKKVRRIGSTKEILVDVRVISACNVDILKYIEEGKFRRDLYYRIAVFPINILPLRDRKEDIPYLIENYLNQLSNKHKKRFMMAQEATILLFNYQWPGNVREMKNILEIATIMSQDGVIRKENLPSIVVDSKLIHKDIKISKLSDTIKRVEQEEINKAIQHFGNHLEGKKKAAKYLGISLATLYNKLGDK